MLKTIIFVDAKLKRLQNLEFLAYGSTSLGSIQPFYRQIPFDALLICKDVLFTVKHDQEAQHTHLHCL